MRPSSHTASGWALLITSVLVVLGHVCVLPGAGHALAAAAGGHDGQASHDAAHGASCEAMRAAPTVDGPGDSAPAPLVAMVSTSAIRTPVTDGDLIVGAGPPKFLLHAALLI